MDELESGFPILKRLEKVGINLDELDYLARRLDSFDSYECRPVPGHGGQAGHVHLI
ncbi:MAG: hypothetical protein ACLRWQ_07875 [Flavonifractor plautii]